MFGNGALDTRGQRHQLVEQFLVSARFVFKLRRDVGKRNLGAIQHRPKDFGDRQAAQRHQAVGFHLKQALGDAACARGGGAGRRNHQHFFEAVSCQTKVGQRH